MAGEANPLVLLSDGQLYDTQLILALACGRAHTILKVKNRDKLCFLFTLLAIEATNRGKPSPQAPFHAPKKV
jgi:hypothetical protein